MGEEKRTGEVPTDHIYTKFSKYNSFQVHVVLLNMEGTDKHPIIWAIFTIYFLNVIKQSRSQCVQCLTSREKNYPFSLSADVFVVMFTAFGNNGKWGLSAFPSDF